MSAADDSAGRPWNPWPIAIIAFFAVAVSGIAAFIVFCACHPADLVAEDYYEQEMRYQGQIERVQRNARHPNPATVTFDPAMRSILIAFPARDPGAQVAGTIQLYRPSSARLDRQFQLEPDAAGLQRIDARELSPGLWKVRVSWETGRQGYSLDQSIVIGPGAP
ncbi:MAG TPA: FixH family protein [Verrucomicrobiae bacterium]